MNLDFSDEQKAARDELRRLLSDHPGLGSARAALEARAAIDRNLWQQLGELGWLAAGIPRQYGGQGLGHEMLCCVAGEIGRSMAAVPFDSSILLAAEAVLIGGTEEQRCAYLPTLASGKKIGAFAIAESAGALTHESIRACFDDGRLVGTKIGVSDGMAADLLVVVARSAGELGLFVIETSDSHVHREPQVGLDPSHTPAKIRFEGARAESL